MDKKMLSEFYSGNETVLGRNKNLLAEIRTTLRVKPEPKEKNDMFRIYFWYWTSEFWTERYISQSGCFDK